MHEKQHQKTSEGTEGLGERGMIGRRGKQEYSIFVINRKIAHLVETNPTRFMASVSSIKHTEVLTLSVCFSLDLSTTSFQTGIHNTQVNYKGLPYPSQILQNTPSAFCYSELPLHTPANFINAKRSLFSAST